MYVSPGGFESNYTIMPQSDQNSDAEWKAAIRNSSPGPTPQANTPQPPPNAYVPPVADWPNLQLTNFGGGVLTNPEIYNIYVGSYFYTKDGQDEIKYNNGFTREYDSQGSGSQGLLAQYGVGPSTFGGSTIVPFWWHACPDTQPATVSEGDVQNYVKNVLASGSMPYNPQGIYNVVLPPNVIITDNQGDISTDGLGGYHGHYTGPNGQIVYYAVTVNPQTTSTGQTQGLGLQLPPSQAQTVVESHELAETMTDPSFPGWLNVNINSPTMDELADVTIDYFGPAGIGPIYQKDSTGYMVQLLWSNEDKRFEIEPPRPELHPRAL
jgi:hypothetical protein